MNLSESSLLFSQLELFRGEESKTLSGDLKHVLPETLLICEKSNQTTFNNARLPEENETEVASAK